MGDTIALVATMDTKAGEAEFISGCIRQQGLSVDIIDVSTKGMFTASVAYSAREVCGRAGIDYSDLFCKNGLRRDDAMAKMGTGAGMILQEMMSGGRLGGVIAIGGNQGTSIAAIAMRYLPIGLPKLIISTVASGNVRPYVEYRDYMMMFPVVDFLGGENSVNRTILSNGAGAIVGMCKYGLPMEKSGMPTIGITCFGNTDAAASRAIEVLKSKGYVVLAFLASGAGGSAMEYFVVSGVIDGVLDLSTHDLLGEVFGDDIYAPLRPRLTEAGKRGIPQVVVPGALEYFCFCDPGSVPEKYRGRMTHYHNPYNTNVSATADELKKAALAMADKLNVSKGPVAVLIPLKSFSDNGREGYALREPETDRVFIETIHAALSPEIPIVEIDANINDPVFADRAAETIDRMMTEHGGVSRECSKNDEGNGPVRAQRHSSCI